MKRLFLEYNAVPAPGPIYLYPPGSLSPVGMAWALHMHYFLYDEAHNVAGVVRDDGLLEDVWRWGPWGTREGTGTTYNPYGFSGQYTDFESGLVYMRNRYYDPRSRRFISEDPIGLAGGINPYMYAGNDPVNSADPMGLQAINLPPVANTPFPRTWTNRFGNRDFQIADEDSALGGGIWGWAAPTAATPPAAQRCVPNAPPGVDIYRNMMLAAYVGQNYPWFYVMVRNGGPWDYKQINRGLYENFGNFHYGAVGTAAGIPPGILQRMAGWAQQRSGNLGSGGSPLGSIPLATTYAIRCRLPQESDSPGEGADETEPSSLVDRCVAAEWLSV